MAANEDRRAGGALLALALLTQQWHTQIPNRQCHRPYYYTWDRMYNVYAIADRAGAIVEHAVLGSLAACDGYGRPYIRESCGRGDMNNDTVMTSTDTARFDLARAASIFDPRADLDDDGDVDSTDQTLFDNKKATWDPLETPPSVGQPFSDVGNPYQFQGVPHFALDSGAFGLAAKLLLNHHRARFSDPVIGTWSTRDPLTYGNRTNYNIEMSAALLSIPSHHQFVLLDNKPSRLFDPSGLWCGGWGAVFPGAGWVNTAGTIAGIGTVSCSYQYCQNWSCPCFICDPVWGAVLWNYSKTIRTCNPFIHSSPW